MTISPFAAREGTSAPQWPNVKKCCRHLIPSSDLFVQSYAVAENFTLSDIEVSGSGVDVTPLKSIRADFWEGDATKQISVKKRDFIEKGGGSSVNQGFGKDFYRKAIQ